MLGEYMQVQQTWTIKRCLDWTQHYLKTHGDEHPRLSSEWLLTAATGKSRTELYMSFDEPLSADELALMHTCIERRRTGEPLQYITGQTAFRFIEVACEPGVLIPRPETELLVDCALEGIDAAQAQQPVHVLEIGCGTGCISCVLARERPGTKLVATDISAHAIALATKNSEELSVADDVTFVQGDLAQGTDPALMGTYAVLVSNPPYIPDEVMRQLPHEVAAFEPHEALAGGPDGLAVFRRILALAPTALMPGGMMALELHEDSLEAARDAASAQGGWSHIEIRQDLTHRPRFLVAIREGELPQQTADGAPEGRTCTCDQQQPTQEVLDDAEHVLRRGGVVVMPTDSVYGIGAAVSPQNPGHARIFDIKHRDPAQTLPLLIANEEELLRLGRDVPDWALQLAHKLWPGALTLIVHATDTVPTEYQRDDGTVAVRVPDSALVRTLARDVGPLAVTSANTHGMPSPISSDDLEKRIVVSADLTLLAGATPAGEASTIVDTTQQTPRIVRQGALALEI